MPIPKNDIRVPNAALRDAVLRAHTRGEISFCGLATSIGLTRMHKDKRRPRPYRRGDGTFLKRMLGIGSYKERNGTRCYNKTINVVYAEKIMRHLGLDPIDVGL